MTQEINALASAVQAKAARTIGEVTSRAVRAVLVAVLVGTLLGTLLAGVIVGAVFR